MGCSSLPVEETLLQNKSFKEFKNIATVGKLEPEEKDLFIKKI